MKRPNLWHFVCPSTSSRNPSLVKMSNVDIHHPLSWVSSVALEMLNPEKVVLISWVWESPVSQAGKGAPKGNKKPLKGTRHEVAVGSAGPEGFGNGAWGDAQRTLAAGLAEHIWTAGKGQCRGVRGEGGSQAQHSSQVLPGQLLSLQEKGKCLCSNDLGLHDCPGTSLSSRSVT